MTSLLHGIISYLRSPAYRVCSAIGFSACTHHDLKRTAPTVGNPLLVVLCNHCINFTTVFQGSLPQNVWTERGSIQAFGINRGQILHHRPHRSRYVFPEHIGTSSFDSGSPPTVPGAIAILWMPNLSVALALRSPASTPALCQYPVFPSCSRTGAVFYSS